MTLNKFLTVAFLSATLVLQAQTKAPQNWFNLDPSNDKFNGLSTDKLYQTLLKDKKSETIIVAVLDSGVDAEHEDLKDIMWTNPGEIPGNGIDDDKNGYVDDIHGWNFIGGKNGNIHHESLELTRLYAKLKKKYEGKTEATADNKKEFKQYETYKQLVETKRKEAKDNMDKYMKIKSDMLDGATKMGVQLMGKGITTENVKALSDDDKSVAMVKKMTLNILEAGEKIASVDELKKEINDQLASPIEHFEVQYKYQYNPDFNDRATIVGDNPDNSYERFYGNNDVEGPDASHGTHVAGIIAAIRNNGIGMNGVADNVRIMSVRCVPDGDERDKDVANAIIYAVDNGASILNMSFGKSYSWDKEAVDKAVKYAADHDVLLVHAAGNDANNNDKGGNFPSKNFEKRGGLFKPKKATNWLEIGALSFKSGEDMPATFSNYGKKMVDVFSPGVEIYSTVPNNNYASFQGTSMASPACAGVAAIIRSYYPELSASQVREIIRTSSVKSDQMVKLPGTARRKEGPQMVKFSDLSNTGGFASSYEAAKIAATTKGKSKSDAKWRKAAEKMTSMTKARP
ncbi:MAG: S8 family peptidase [Saprospiraceae bacterium]